mgnify:CR=1 FL=1
MNELANQQAPLRSIELFAGAGGGILAGQIHGWRTDPYAASVLVQRQEDEALDPFPIWDSVETFTGEVLDPFRGVDIVAGGFPCTDIAVCGKGEGIEGKESGMFKHMARIIDEVRPRVGVWIENSPMLAMGRGLGTVLCSLQEMGYDEIKWGVVGARSTGAPHRRDRIWIWAVENSQPQGLQGSGRPGEENGEGATGASQRPSEVPHAHSKRGRRGNTGREDAMDADPCSEKRIPDPTAIRGEEGWECVGCGKPVFGGCEHYHGEWQCSDCGEWTYPFHYDFAEGCQSCGSANVSHPDLKGLEGWTGDESDEHEPRRLGEEARRSASEKTLRPGLHWWSAEPGLGRVADGMADRMDEHGTPEPGSVPRLAEGIRNRIDRLKCIGNGQVPACSSLALEILSNQNE